MSEAAIQTVARGPSREELLGRACELVPVLKERAAKTEERRRMLDETERDFHDTGLFRMLQPARIGGSELDYAVLVDLSAEIARACPSSAWNLANLGSHHWMLAMWPERAQHEVWDQSVDTLVASGLIFPAGRAKRVEGGYQLSGRWPFSSGVDQSDWNMLAGLVQSEDEDEPPEYRIFLVPKQDYDIIDTWFAVGLQGTGSKDVAADNIFVPAYRTLAVDDTKGGPTPGSKINPNPLYQIPAFATFPFVLSGIALGAVRGVWDEYTDSLRTKVAKYSGAKLSDMQSVQIKIAEAGVEIDTAELIMLTACDKAMRDAEANRIPDMHEKVKYRRDGAYSVGLCVQAINTLFKLGGASGLYSQHSLQRAFRDVHAVSSHLSFNFDVNGASFGRVALGLDPNNPTL